MADLKHVATIAKGEKIPEWLVVQEPTHPDARMARITANAAIAVFEIGETYFVLPLTLQGVPFRIDGAREIALMAGNMRVVWPGGWFSMEVDGSGDTVRLA